MSPAKSHWPVLFDKACEAINACNKEIDWCWGGGTALAWYLDHRVSYDIDIFLNSHADLEQLYPRNNAYAKSELPAPQQPGHYLKFPLDEGEIDFIVAARRSQKPYEIKTVRERQIKVETPEEILCKKLHYRGSKAVVRDIFDLWATHKLLPDHFAIAIQTEKEGSRRMIDVMRRKKNRINKEFQLSVDLTPIGSKLIEEFDFNAAEFSKTIEKLLDASEL